MLTKYSHGQLSDALEVIRTAASDLQNRGIPLWEPSTMTAETLFTECSPDSVITGYVNNEPASAMILLTHDPEFWPNIPRMQSGFIHKLSVIPRFKGNGLAQQMIKYAEKHLTSRGITELRLDCAGDRPKLCAVYEQCGFTKVDQKMVGLYLVAFFEKHVGSQA